MILDRASQPAFGTKYLPRRLSGLGMALMLSLAISEDWIAKLSRARLAWCDSNAPLREQVQNYKNQFGALIDTPLPKTCLTMSTKRIRLKRMRYCLRRLHGLGNTSVQLLEHNYWIVLTFRW
jgi:hypothetical protein